ncbi:MAG TPA: hypothetical protein VK850_00585, partial [Candidatus Binatia bacterium]|nr:hypothetical protein [Candidatus Binatia bacterium]
MTTKLFLLCAALFAIVPEIGAQGTGFTYQGRLSDNGGPANGVYDLQFAIYDLASGGSKQGGPLTNLAGVSNGLFTVTLDFGVGVFTGNERWLEVAVRTNGNTAAYTTLSPRQALTAAPYAIRAASANSATMANGVTGNVSASQIVGSLAASNIGVGTITSSNLAAGAAAANLNAAGQSGVSGGGMILSEDANATNLATAGYVKIGRVDLASEAWTKRQPPLFVPQRREGHTAVWTGSEMIVWGGASGAVFFNDGARFNPVDSSWTAIASTGAPATRSGHSVVWTGSEMIVWGGSNNTTYYADGGRYDPAGNSWTAVSTTNGPAARTLQTAVWTGSEMIVWGGISNATFRADGGRYNPTGNVWTAVSTNSAPAPRNFHSAV